MIRQETIIKRMILKTALSLLFVTFTLCSQHSNTDVIWTCPALVEGRAVIPFSKLMDF